MPCVAACVVLKKTKEKQLSCRPMERASSQPCNFPNKQTVNIWRIRISRSCSCSSNRWVGIRHWHWQTGIGSLGSSRPASMIELSLSLHQPIGPYIRLPRGLSGHPWHPNKQSCSLTRASSASLRYGTPYVVCSNSTVVSMVHHLPGPWSILDGALRTFSRLLRESSIGDMGRWGDDLD